MIELGAYNKLSILRDTDPGLFLGDDEGNEVLLPNRYAPQLFDIGDSIEVFVYLDNEDARWQLPISHILRKVNLHSYVVMRSHNTVPFLTGGLSKNYFARSKSRFLK